MNSHIQTMEFYGVVKSISYGKFLIVLQKDFNKKPLLKEKEISGILSGKIKKNRIKITTGDKVRVELSSDNLQEGIIIFREK